MHDLLVTQKGKKPVSSLRVQPGIILRASDERKKCPVSACKFKTSIGNKREEINESKLRCPPSAASSRNLRAPYSAVDEHQGWDSRDVAQGYQMAVRGTCSSHLG